MESNIQRPLSDVKNKTSQKTFDVGSWTLDKLGDALLLIYFLVLARQYLWWGTNRNSVAWIASALLAIVVGYFYFSAREVSASNKSALPLWLLAVLPLVLIYAMRVVYPDTSFDVLNYRLLHAERSLVGFLYLPGDFFPTPAPYNPAPDMVTGLFRHALGYRLGTIANLLAMIWAARITEKLLRPLLQNAWVRATAVLLAMMAEHLLFEINNYMADLLALPLLLEATYLALRHGECKNRRRNLLCIALLLGMAVTFKLTNAGVALPIVLLCAYRELTASSAGYLQKAKQTGVTAVLCALAFVLPLVPFSVYLYRETGSVVFPVFNGVFKSPYWPPTNVWDPRWGPKGLWEKLVWPVLISFRADRLSELSVYSGKISLGFVVALIGFLFVRRDRYLREIFFLVVAATVLWSVSTGYIRYAFYLEVMAAIAIIGLAAKLMNGRSGSGKIVSAMLWLGLFVQACLAGYYISQTEWGTRPIASALAYRREAPYLFHDRSLRNFLDADTLNRLDQVDVWIVSSIKTTGIEVALRPEAPMIGTNIYEFFDSNQGRNKFRKALKLAEGKRMYSLAFAEDLEGAETNLQRRGLVATQKIPLEIPYYSSNARIKVFLIAVATPDETATAAQDPRNAGKYRARIFVTQPPAVMKPGAKEVLQVKVKNGGNMLWLARAPQGWMNSVTLADRWLSADENDVVNDLDSRAVLPHDLKPGEEVELTLTVTAPGMPGIYMLELDMVHEGVTWFYQQGSPTLRWQVKVEK
jgi:TM2 domain-containing membrane protein YozV